MNFELPWNPAKVNQRTGRVNRIGQKSKCINVINLIAKHSIEERIMDGIKLKGDLFDGVFDGGKNEVDFLAEENVEPLEEQLSQEERDELVDDPAEKMEEVLNQGMGFISGLLEMATGKKLGVAEGSEKMVSLDKETGEVALKFTLPGFSKG